MNRKTISIILFLCSFFRVFAAEPFKISGYVTDTQTGEPLIGAAVLLSEREGVVTNNYGYYSISVPTQTEIKLDFAYLGYERKTVTVNPQKDDIVNVALVPDETISEAVISSYSESGIHSTLMGSITIPKTLLKQTPVALGEPDVLKTLQLLPGVQGAEEGFSGIYIRGGNLDETLFLLDGTVLYNVSHLLGIFSSFAPEAIKSVTLYKGPFPARFGGRASGVVDVRTNEGDMYKTKGSVSVGLLNDRFHIEGPIMDGKLSYSLSGRVLHTFLFAPVMDLAKTGMNYYFYDFNGKLSYRIGAKDRLYLSGYMGDDCFYSDRVMPIGDYKGEVYGHENEKSELKWGTKLVSLRWNHVFSPSLFSETSLSFSKFRNDSYLENRPQEYEASESWRNELYTSKNSIRDISLNSDFDFSLDNSTRLRFGLSLTNHLYSPTTSAVYNSYIGDEWVSDASQTNELRSLGWENALYAEIDFKPLDRLSVNAGVRGLQMTSGDASYYSLEPRLSAKFKLTDGFAIKSAIGRVSQYVHLLSSSSYLSVPTDIWVPVTDKIKPVVSDMVSAGFYYSGLKGWEFSVEGYYKRSANVIDYKDGKSFFSTSDNWSETVSLGKAKSRGLEFFVNKTVGKLTGMASYTLSKTERQYPDGSVNKGEWFPDRYDRRHKLSISASYKLKDNIDLNALWIYNSGAKATVPDRITIAPMAPVPEIDISSGQYLGMPFVSGKNNYSLPASHRLDLSVNLHKKLKRGERVWTLGVYNAYNAMNPNIVYIRAIKGDAEYKLSEWRYSLRKITILPIMPFFNYTYNF